MNAFDYFFENTFDSKRNFVLGAQKTITFHELYQRCVKLAAYLNMTIGKEQNVLLIGHNSVFFVTAYLGILKSHNVAVPLNPEIEQSNLDYILKTCQFKLAIITSQMSTKYQLNDVPMLNEEEVAGLFNKTSLKIESAGEDSSDQLAEIIFTSGSTGEPKGVMISHKNLIANTQSIIDYLKLSHNDIMLVVLPFYYCYGLSLLHTHLRVGGSIVFNNMFIFLGNVIKNLNRYKCTGFAGVPSHFQILLRKSDSFKSQQFPYLKYVTQAGGKLHDVFIKEFIETFPKINFYVMYGQTEATARLSYLPPDKLPEKIGSCGKGIPGVKLIVADESGKPVHPGEIGEILAHGDNIMKGYYNDQESTENTIKNGWLHTGDLATIDQEGYIYLTARKKEIIKVGGKRVSPKEIEEVIVAMPEVVDCTIEAVFDELLGEALKAKVIIKESSSITSETLKSWCATRLSTYKIPQIIELSDKISISATGKKVKL